jgi:hypothetical protein
MEIHFNALTQTTHNKQRRLGTGQHDMKRAADDMDNTAVDEFPRWKHQPWEDRLEDYNVDNNHYVTIAIKRSQSDSYGYHLREHTADGQILFAASSMARIVLIDAKMGRDYKHHGLGIYFDIPLKIDVLGADDICAKLTIEGHDIRVACDRDARFNKWGFTNKKGNVLMSGHRYPPGAAGYHMTMWTIKCIELSSRDSYTAELYSAIMHQYVDKNRSKISSTRNK